MTRIKKLEWTKEHVIICFFAVRYDNYTKAKATQKYYQQNKKSFDTVAKLDFQNLNGRTRNVRKQEFPYSVMQ